MQFYSIIIVFWKFWWTQDHSCWWRSSNAPRIADNSLGDQKRSTWNSGDDGGYDDDDHDYDDDGGDDNPFGDQNWFTQNIYSAVQKR